MVSATFHSPLEQAAADMAASRATSADSKTIKKIAASDHPQDAQATSESQKLAPSRPPYNWRGLALRVLPPLVGLALMVLLWQVVSVKTGGSIPTPLDTWKQALIVFADPFYRNGPNDQGVGWNVLASLQRVAVGFGLAALVGIPLGFAIGRFEFLGRMLNPLISLLRPVSPLAWLPIGLLVFKGANPAAIWTIFICSIWPMVINTAIGVQRVPSDYMNVAKVLFLY